MSKIYCIECGKEKLPQQMTEDGICIVCKDKLQGKEHTPEKDWQDLIDSDQIDEDRLVVSEQDN